MCGLEVEHQSFRRYYQSRGKYVLSSVIRQKGESQNGCFKKTKHTKYSKKRTYLNPCYAHITGFEILPFAFLPTIYKSYYRFLQKNIQLRAYQNKIKNHFGEHCSKVISLKIQKLDNKLQRRILYPIRQL